jgi:uncharacterized Tic20 family protein
MTSHPPEPPAPWPPPPPEEERPASQARRPGPPDEWRAFQRPPGDQPVNGHRAAAYPPDGAPAPLADYAPETGYEHAPGPPPGAGYAPDDYPDYPVTTGYPDRPGYPQDSYAPAGYPGPPGYPAGADYPPMPDYPPLPDYPPDPGYPPAPDYPDLPGYRTASGHPDAAYLPGGYPAADYPRGGHPAGGAQVAEFPAADSSWVLEGAPVTHEEYVHPGDGPASAVDTPRARAGPEPAGAASADAASADAAPGTGPQGTQWAMLAYLTVPFFGLLVPLAIYLTSLRRSRWLRGHAAQAVNVWLTGILYDLSALIIGAVLLLDSPRVALAVVVPLVIVLWLTTLAFLVRAAARASRGETYTFPRWLCAPMVR